MKAKKETQKLGKIRKNSKKAFEVVSKKPPKVEKNPKWQKTDQIHKRVVQGPKKAMKGLVTKLEQYQLSALFTRELKSAFF
jgi:hypothetical protein